MGENGNGAAVDDAIIGQCCGNAGFLEEASAFTIDRMSARMNATG